MARTYGTQIESSDVAKAGAGTGSVTSASAQVVAANPQRVLLVLANNDATNPIFLGLGTAAVVNGGIRLNPGASISLKEFTGAVFAIAGVAGPLALGYAEI